MTKIKMALALDKLIKDVKEEKILWNDNFSHTNDEEESAWNRVASKNMLTGGEAKSIFKVLCKKYRQEAQKPFSSWQLFETLKFLDNKSEDTSIKTEIPDQSIPSPISNHEEETFVELLEVKDEDFSDDGEDNDDNEMPEKSANNNSGSSKVAVTKTTPPKTKNKTTGTGTGTGDKKATSVAHLINNDLNQKNLLKDSIEKQSPSTEKEKPNHNNGTVVEKIQNALPPSITIKKEKEITPSSSSTPSSTSSSILNSLKRKYASSSSPETNNHSHQSHNGSNSNHNQKDSDLEHGHVEKRRLIKMTATENSEQVNTHQQQKQQNHHHNQKHKSQQQQHRRSLQEFIKNDLKSMSAEASNTISNLTAATALNTINNITNATTNIDDDEHRKFSSFGNYIATTMNRLTPKLAAKLEIKVLQAIIDVNSEMINRF